MGFFTRHPKDDADPAMGSSGSVPGGGQAPLQRRRNSAAAQRDSAADELRRRARRRLIGAIAMVLAAVIVLPMVLDSPPETVTDDIAIRIPSQATPFEPRFAEAPREPELPAGSEAGEGAAALPAAPGEAAAVAVDPRVPASIATITPLPGSKPEPAPRVEPTAPKPPATPSPTPAPARTQADAEAARALALLQGRAPAEVASASRDSTRFAVQVVAVRSRSGADELLGRLRSAGLSAYIETVKTPDGEVHRVRLGPYASRSQAEAAQSRLQGLPGGYQGNLVPL